MHRMGNHTLAAPCGATRRNLARWPRVLVALGESPASHRDRRWAWRTRREEGEYRQYATDEQRRSAGFSVGQMQRDFYHGLLAVSTPFLMRHGRLRRNLRPRSPMLSVDAGRRFKDSREDYPPQPGRSWEGQLDSQPTRSFVAKHREGNVPERHTFSRIPSSFSGVSFRHVTAFGSIFSDVFY